MRSEENVNQLTIRETPGVLWVFGLFFVFVGGVFVYGSLGGFANAGEVPRYALYLSFLLGCSGVAVGAWTILRAPMTTVTIDRQTKTVVHRRRGLFVADDKIYVFDDVKGFCLIEERDSEGDAVWSLGVELIGGGTIKISSLESHDSFYVRDFVFQINRFMNKQMPSSQAVFQLKDESGGEIS